MAAATAKPRPFQSRHVLSACVLLLCSILLLHRYPYTKPLDHFRYRISPFLRARNNTIASAEWELPKPLSELVPFVRGSAEADALRDRPWTRPGILLTYARPLDTNESFTHVFLYATGVKMGKYGRNVTVVGCLLGKDVYKAVVAPGDVYVCTVYRTVERGEEVQLVLLRDSVLEKALSGMTLGGLDVTMRKEDIAELPKGVKIRLPRPRKVSEYAVLTSSGRVSHIAPGLGTLRNRARYKVCMGTQMKTFPHLLPDWVRYHRKLGVDQVYILDNAADKALEGYLPAGMTGVEVVYWPFQKSQIQAMSVLLVALRESCEWILLSDADEYVLLGLDTHGKAAGVREYVDRIPRDVTQHYLPYVTMGVSGHVTRPKGAVAEAYTYLHSKQKRNGKTFARSDAGWYASKIHVAWSPGDAGVERVKAGRYETRMGERGVLVHFQKRSFEEMMLKRGVGSGSLGDVQFGGGERKMVKGVPRPYREVDEELRYTFFRDVWRVVEKGEVQTCLVRGEESTLVGSSRRHSLVSESP